MNGKRELVVDVDNPFDLSGLIHDLVERLKELSLEGVPDRGTATLDASWMASLAKTAAVSSDYVLAGKVFGLLIECRYSDDDGLLGTFLERVEASREIPCGVMESFFWSFLDHHDLGSATAGAFARNGNYDFMRSDWAEASGVGLADIDDEDLAECLEAVVLDAHSYFVDGDSGGADLLSTYCRAAPRIYKDPVALWSWFALDVCDALGQYDMGNRAPITEAILGWPLPEEGPQREEVRTMLRNADTWKLLDEEGYELWWVEPWGDEE